MSRLPAFLIVWALLLCRAGFAPAAPIHIGVSIDASGSVSNPEFALQIQGVASAVNTVLGGLPDNTVRLTVRQFSNSSQSILAPTLVNSGNLAGVVNTIQTAPRAFFGGTNFNAAITDLVNQMTGAPDYDLSDRAAINVSTDGFGSLSGATVPSAVAAGIDEISAEAIGPGANVPFLQNALVFPQPGVLAPPFVQGQGFVIAVNNFQEFEAAFTQKLQFVAAPTPIPEPTSLAVWGIVGLGGAAYGWRRKRRQRRLADTAAA